MTLLPQRVPRSLHPAGWWLWALGLAAAATRTTNPMLLALIIAVAACVVAARRDDAPWALGVPPLPVARAVIVLARVVFRILFGGGHGGHVLFTLPQVPLPDWAAGIRLLGPVTAEQLLGGALRRAAAGHHGDLRRRGQRPGQPQAAAQAVPGALYEVGTAVVVALSVRPQLVESVQRVRRARRAARRPAAPACGPCAASSSPCSRTPWTGPWRWPPPWTPAATAGAADQPALVHAAHRRAGARRAAAASASGCTDCSTPPRPATSALPMLAAGLLVAAVGSAGSPGGGCRAPLPARPVAGVPESAGGGLRARRRGRALPDRPGRPRQPLPVAQPAGLADSCPPLPTAAVLIGCAARRASPHRRARRPTRSPLIPRRPTMSMIEFAARDRHLRRQHRHRCSTTST